MDGWMDGWMGGWMDGWMDGLPDRRMINDSRPCVPKITANHDSRRHINKTRLL